MGCGVRFYDLEREPPDVILATQWISLLYVPIIPLRRARCRVGLVSAPLPDFDDRLTFTECRRAPMEVGGIVVTYISALAALLVTIGPIAFFIWLTEGRAAKPSEVGVVFGFILLTVGLMIWQQNRPKRFLDAMRSYDDCNASADAEQERLETARSDWEKRHVIPERSFLYAMVVGLVPGVVIGQWFGFGGNLLNVVSLATGAAAAGILWCFDRLLVWDRDQGHPP